MSPPQLHSTSFLSVSFNSWTLDAKKILDVGWSSFTLDKGSLNFLGTQHIAFPDVQKLGNTGLTKEVGCHHYSQDFVSEEYQTFRYGTTAKIGWDAAAVEFQLNLAELQGQYNSVIILVYDQERSFSVLQKLGMDPSTEHIGLRDFL